MEVLQEGMIKLLEIVIGGALAIASVYATLFVTKATQKAKIEIAKLKGTSYKATTEQAKKLLNDSLDSVDVLLKTNIIAMENTLKKELAKGVEDGKIEKEELNKLAFAVKENVLNQLGEDTVMILNNGLNDLNGYIEARLEQVLVEVKEKNNIAGK